MKVKTWLLPLLILGSLSVSGLREQPSKKLVQEAVCRVICSRENTISTDPSVWFACLTKCDSHPPLHIPVLEIGAPVQPEYLCHMNERTVVLGLDTGRYIVEYRNRTSDWVDVEVVNIHDNRPRTYEFDIPMAGPHQLRFTRAFGDGISRPLTSDWIAVYNTDVRSENVLDIRLHCLLPDSPSQATAAEETVNAQIVFTRLKDVACEYSTTFSGAGDTDKKTAQIDLSKRGIPEVTFEHIRPGTNFTVTYASEYYPDTTKERAGKEFSIPLRLPSSNWRRGVYCVPGKVEHINASETSHDDGNIYDVHVTWRPPDNFSEYFIINMTTDGAEFDGIRERSLNRSGLFITGIFKDMEILQEYNVSIRGYSYLQQGLEASKRFKLPEKAIGPPALDTTIGITVLACVSLVVVTGVFAYLIRRRQKQRQKKTKVSSMDAEYLDVDNILAETPCAREHAETPIYNDTTVSLQARFVINDEPRIMHPVLRQMGTKNESVAAQDHSAIDSSHYETRL